MKIGLELEYWTVDRKGELVSCKNLAQKIDSGEQEFVESLLEIKTSPHEDIAGLRKEAMKSLKEVLSEAQELGLKIVPMGTPLNTGNIEMIETRRGQIQRQIIGQELEAAKRVAGTHIHFEKQDVKKQLNIMTAMDPALALMNSSPYYQGEKLASSSRNQVYRYRCYRNFPKHGQLWNYTDSVQGWEKRVQKRFEEFKEAGKMNGINPREIEQHFSPHDALWTPVRLRKQFPTVEWRAPDTGGIKDALRLAEESKKVMEKAMQYKFDSEILEFKKLKQLSRKAIRKGLEDVEVTKYLNKLGFSPEDYNPYTPQITENITESKACKLRLEASELIENDVAGLRD